MILLSSSSVCAAIVAVAATAVAGIVRFEDLDEYTPNLIPSQKNADSNKLFPMGDCHGFKLEEATIDQMQKAMESRKLTSVQLVDCYMTRTFQTQQYIK